MTLQIAHILLLLTMQGPTPLMQSDATRDGIAGPVCKVSTYEMNGPITRGRQPKPALRDLLSVTTFDERGNESRVEHFNEGKLSSYTEKSATPEARSEVEHADSETEFFTTNDPAVAVPLPDRDAKNWYIHRAQSKLIKRGDGYLVGEVVVAADRWSLPIGREITYVYGLDNRLVETRIKFREESAPRVAMRAA